MQLKRFAFQFNLIKVLNIPSSKEVENFISDWNGIERVGGEWQFYTTGEASIELKPLGKLLNSGSYLIKLYAKFSHPIEKLEVITDKGSAYLFPTPFGRYEGSINLLGKPEEFLIKLPQGLYGRIERMVIKKVGKLKESVVDVVVKKTGEKLSNSEQNVILTVEKIGYIEGVRIIKELNLCYIFGWYIFNKEPDIVIDFKSDKGLSFSIKPDKIFQFYRRDIIQVFQSHADKIKNINKAGFVILCKDLIDSNIKEVSISEEGSKTEIAKALQDRIVSYSVYDVEAIINDLNGIYMENQEEKEEFYEEIAIPVVLEIQKFKKKLFDKYPEDVFVYGNVPKNPKVSIIIPIYKEFVFVDNHMLSFVKDSWLLENCEIIYVLDDPSLKDAFFAEMEVLNMLYEVPFKIVYGYTNRGFSEANNLGAKYASGEYLIFMNSDVIPKDIEWAKKLVEFLEGNQDAGAVAPLLLFPNESIQHMGMVFIENKFYNIYFNHHIFMGLPPEKVIDENKPIECEMLTGALICISKNLFEKIGGWSYDFVKGDFEDSDFSLKIRSIGKKLYVLPWVKMYHLEGASQQFTPERFSRTLMNARILKYKFKELGLGGK